MRLLKGMSDIRCESGDSFTTNQLVFCVALVRPVASVTVDMADPATVEASSVTMVSVSNSVPSDAPEGAGCGVGGGKFLGLIS